MVEGLAGGDTDKRPTSGWRARPARAWLVRAAIVVLPALSGAASAWFLQENLPRPDSAVSTVARWSIVIAGSVASVAVLTRLMQRFAPLAFLLSLTLVFPDKAPSRYKVARRAGKLRSGDRAATSSSDLDGAGRVLALIAALGAHDKRSRGHSERVRVFTEMLAEEMRIPPAERDKLRWAALLHDIGKLTVPSVILNKPDRPSEREWEILHNHPSEGMRIATPLLALLGPWAGAIRHHHERYDGNGYPDGLSGDDIPYGARILAVSDAYEVMTAARPYKTPLGARAARTELVRSAGNHFDPAIVRAFLNISVGRLWRGIGFAAMLAQLPLLGTLFHRGIAQRIGRDAASLSAAGALVVTMAATGMMGTRAPAPVATTPVANDGTAPAEADLGEAIPNESEETVGNQIPDRQELSEEGSRRGPPRSAPGSTEPSRTEPGEGSERRDEPSSDPSPRPSPEDEPEEPPEDHFASGTIAISTPTSPTLGGATQGEFLLTCGVPQSQGVDGWVFPLPEETARADATAGISGTSDAPIGYDLDAFFYSAECESLGSLEGATPDPGGPLPPATRYVVVNQPSGLDTAISLAVTH